MNGRVAYVTSGGVINTSASQDAEWAKLTTPSLLVPEGWEKAFLSTYILDYPQFVHQMFKSGLVDLTFYRDWVIEGWEVDTTKLRSDSYGCFFNYAYRIHAGKKELLIDTDRDGDLRDEEVVLPRLKEVLPPDNKIPSYSVYVLMHSRVGNSIQPLKVPYFFTEYQNEIWAEELSYWQSTHPDFFLRARSSGGGIDREASFSFNDSISLLPNTHFQSGNLTYKLLGQDDMGRFILQQVPNDKEVKTGSIGFASPDIKGVDFLTKKPFGPDDYKGKYVLVKFWGSWCGPCIQSMPDYEQIYQELPSNTNLVLVGVAYDNEEDLRSYLKANPLSWPQILCTSEKNSLISEFSVRGYPTNFLIGPDGKIIAINPSKEQIQAVATKL